MVRYLLSRGATVPPISEWPTNTNVYKALRAQKMKNDGGTVLEYKKFKAMSEAERAAL